MFNKKAKKLEKALKAKEQMQDCNDPELCALLNVRDKLITHAQDSHLASSNFKEKLEQDILRARRTERASSTEKSMNKQIMSFFASFHHQRVVVGVSSLLIVAIVATTFQYWPGVRNNPSSPFGEFSRLILDPAYAQDNFEIEPVSGDSTGVEADTSFIITSKGALDSEILKENISLSPRAEFTFEVIDDHTFKVTPIKTLENNTTYNIEISASFIAENGTSFERDYSWAFQVKDSFKVKHTLPGKNSSNVPLSTGIEVTFSHENVEDVENHITISPKVNGRFETHGQTVVFVPQILAEGTVYTVTVSGASHVVGSQNTLGEDYVFQFETLSSAHNANQHDRQKVSFIENELQYSTEDTIAIPVYAYGEEAKKVEVEIFAYNNSTDFISDLSDKMSVPDWSVYQKSAFLVDTSKMSSIFTATLEIQTISEVNNGIHFLVLPESLPKGFYVLENKSASRFDKQAFIQVTDLSAYATVTETDTLVWVNNVKSDQPTVSAKLTFTENNTTATTNSTGIATFATEKLIDANSQDAFKKIMSIKAGNDELIMVLNRFNGYYYNNTSTSASDYWKYIYTDRSLYHPGDQIKYWGFVKNRDLKATDSVHVKLVSNGYRDFYNNYVVLQEQEIILNNGIFEGSINLENTTPGYYDLQFFVGDNLIQSSYINVQTYTKPAYSIDIQPAKAAMFAGEDVKFDISANFFEGTPLPDTEFKVRVSGTSQSAVDKVLKTDEFGKMSVSYTPVISTCNLTSSYCPLVNSVTLSVSPVNSEVAEINEYSRVNVYNANAVIDQEVIRNNGTALVNATVRSVDLAGGEGELVSDLRIEGDIIEITYNRVETGEYYDFINKIVRKTYRYNKIENKIGNFSGTSDSNGEYHYNFPITQDKSYKVNISVVDAEGRMNKATSYAYAPIEYRSAYSSDYYFLKNFDKDMTYKLGDLAKFELQNNEERVQDGENKFLYYQLQRGLRAYEVDSSADYSFTFEQKHAPNVVLKAVYFDGQTYKIAGNQFNYSGAKLDTADSELNIQVKTEKIEYLPGEEVKLNVKVVDKNGAGKKANVNVNVVDEAYYAVSNESVNTLDNLYASVPGGEIIDSFSHKYSGLLTIPGGAEGGGCFLGETQITMADGSKKNIENIEAGDMILTRLSEKSNTLVPGRVLETFEHYVSEYMIINGSLKVTPVHKVYMNGGWQVIGNAEVGDILINSEGFPVRIDSIEWKHEPVYVYNFHVETYHTYLANDIYVHNDKGGDGSVRETFLDAAVFKTLETDQNGNGEITFTLPDNITSWRITTQAISSDIKAGFDVTKLPVTKPIFANVVIADEYLTTDKPSFAVRAFGKALLTGDTVSFNVLSDSLGLEETKDGKAFKSTYFDLPSLTDKLGEHSITFGASTYDYNDALRLRVSVVESRLMETIQKFAVGSEDLIVDGAEDGRTTVVFSDENQGRLYNSLRSLKWGYGDRVDQKLSRQIGQDLLDSYFAEPKTGDVVDMSLYQQGGGISLLPYSDSELVLSAKVAVAGAKYVDKEALASYFYNVVANKKSNTDEIATALWGLAGLNEPVLVKIQNMAAIKDLSVTEKLYIALALEEIGDKENARTLYAEVMAENGEAYEDYIRINVEDDKDKTLEASALASMLAAGLQAEHKDSLWNYVATARSNERLVSLERAIFIGKTLPTLVPGAVSFKVEVNGKTETVELEKGSTHTISVSPEQRRTIRLLDIKGNLGVTSHYEVPLKDVSIDDSHVDVDRKYFVDGVETNAFKEGGIVEVRVYPKFIENAVEGEYQITDVLPSGMSIISRPYRYSDNTTKGAIRYPYQIDGQRIKFTADSSSYNASRDYFKYYVRVTNPGTYTVEPIMINSMKVPSIQSFSDALEITVK
ncbi:hypothetical protein COV92_00850 [Candidatus Uhrbacteria bacterium CG11_big_fil_rev_8_21_14_0_20_41_9]|nr:MAG: hypothetical protein COV92_00850 [Candidatus Uhrbacteria bacterium CG11_big_fil_rev_8_21_14_0_20_41_9]